MKKIFFGILAIVAMVATSCQQEHDLTIKGGVATVSFNVGAPQMSRAFSDGTSATVLQYAVYEGTNELTDLTVNEANAKVINGSTTVELQLVTGNEYTVIFWADNANAPYTVDWATGTLTVDYSNVLSNNEELDAFYAKHTFTVKGAQTETVYLKRPFAQVNIGTNDYAAAKSAGYEPEYSYVKVSNIYNTLNLWDGAVSNEEAVTYKYAQIPAGETFPVAGYEYLAMNYLLVNEAETVNVEFGYGESSTAAEKTRTVGSVPVQRNYRTNIYGQLFTSNVDINVVIEPEYNTPAYEAEITIVNSLNELELVLANAEAGSTIVLSNQITGDIALNEAKDVIIDATLSEDVRFVTNANTKIEDVTLKNIDFEFVTGTGQKGGACVVIDAAAQIENLVIENCNLVGDNNKNSYGIVGQNTNASIVVKNCHFSNMGYAIQTIAGGGYKSLVVEGCTFENINSWVIMPQYGYTGDLTVNGCTFNNVSDGLVKTGAFNSTFTFTNNTITNSAGHDGKDSKWFEVKASANGGTVVIDGNTKDGVAWTPGVDQGLI